MSKSKTEQEGEMTREEPKNEREQRISDEGWAQGRMLGMSEGAQRITAELRRLSGHFYAKKDDAEAKATRLLAVQMEVIADGLKINYEQKYKAKEVSP